MAGTRTILVTGGTGQQGGAVARCLVAKGRKVRIMTRSPQKAKELENKGFEVVRGDFDDKESLDEAVHGVDGVFLMGTPFEKGEKAEVEHGKAVILACWKAGTPHIVYSSVCDAPSSTGIPHFESKGKVEAYLKRTENAYTILRPVWFMENFTAPWLYPGIEKGVLSTPTRPDRLLQMIALDDIGEFASEAFLRPSEFAEKEIDLAGDSLTFPEVAKRIGAVMGREVRYQPIPEDEAESAVGHDFALMYRWFNKGGYQVDIEGLRRRYGIKLTSFDEFLRRSSLYRKAA